MTSESLKNNMKVATVALELFKQRSSQSGINPKHLAIECFRDATIFNEIAEDVLSNGIEMYSESSDPLDVAFAPNLKKTHPINLMSRAWGNLDKLKEILATLDANPATESYEPFGWGRPEVNQARALFPAVVDRAQQFALGK